MQEQNRQLQEQLAKAEEEKKQLENEHKLREDAIKSQYESRYAIQSFFVQLHGYLMIG